MPINLQDIIDKAQGTLTTIPEWIQTGVPNNIKSGNHRELWLENTQQIKDIAQYLQEQSSNSFKNATIIIAAGHIQGNNIRINIPDLKQHSTPFCYYNGVLLTPNLISTATQSFLFINNNQAPTPIIIGDEIVIFYQ